MGGSKSTPELAEAIDRIVCEYSDDLVIEDYLIEQLSPMETRLVKKEYALAGIKNGLTVGILFVDQNSCMRSCRRSGAGRRHLIRRPTNQSSTLHIKLNVHTI